MDKKAKQDLIERYWQQIYDRALRKHNDHDRLHAVLYDLQPIVVDMLERALDERERLRQKESWQTC